MYGNPAGTDYSGMERSLPYSGMPPGYPYGAPAVSLDAATAAACASQYCTTQDPFYLAGGYHYSLLPDIRHEPTGPPMALGPNGKPKRRRVITFEQRKAANIRERRRMFNLNEAFDELRKTVPTFSYEKRLSRIETLRLAITYISYMGEIVKGKDPDKIKLLRISGVEGNKSVSKKQVATTSVVASTAPDQTSKATHRERAVVKMEQPDPEESACCEMDSKLCNKHCGGGRQYVEAVAADIETVHH